MSIVGNGDWGGMVGGKDRGMVGELDQCLYDSLYWWVRLGG